MKRFNIFAGNYGSGKTELSLNMAVLAANAGKRTVLIDLDIVNPYFRSSEHEEELLREGIRTIKPCFANTAVDVPSLPGEIYAPFDIAYDCAIFDAGGDPVGAAALGLLAEKFDLVAEETEFFYVINACRPLQEEPEQIADMLRQIEAKSRMKVTGLVNNTNLAQETQAETVLRGAEIVRSVSNITGIPVRYTSALESVAKELREFDGELFPISLYMRPEWLDAKY